VRILTDFARLGAVEIVSALPLPTNKTRGYQESLGCVLTAVVVVLASAITLLGYWPSS
jgi:hypothetical protein